MVPPKTICGAAQLVIQCKQDFAFLNDDNGVILPSLTMRLHRERAFSLVELSIVLVILGLLVGGVLSGQSLIRSSELRSVVTQHDQFLTATRSFRDKYFGLPGDITNATLIWGAQAVPASCATTASTGKATCNGDGDGFILYANTGATSQENFRFWQQLANAGFISGSFSGTDGGGGFSGTAATSNSPAGKLGSTLWAVDYIGNISGTNAIQFSGDYGNVFYFGVHQ